MTYRLIDKTNPVLLLESFNSKEKSNRKTKTKSKIDNLPEESLNVWMVHFNTIFKECSNGKFRLKDYETFLGSSCPSEMIHATVGLLDTCLSDMDIGTIYNSIVDKDAFTIVAFSSRANTARRLQKSAENCKDKPSKIEEITKFLSRTKENEDSEAKEDVYSAGEEKADDFQLIFDDEESTEEEVGAEGDQDEEDDDEEDFSRGYNGYIRTVYQRKLDHLSEEIRSDTEIGFENQIVGCLSLKLRHVDVRRIVHVTMLGVLRQYRSRGLGRHLVNLALDQKIVSRYDAVVVHADFSACNFFKKFGFSDDALLNTQWHSLEPEYSNCSLLTLLPAYSCTPRPGGEILAEEFSAAEMEVDLRLWQQKVTEVHCFQLQAFHRMRAEIEHLKGTIKNQEKIMKDLLKELRESNKERVRLERCLKKTSSNKTNQSTDAQIKSDDEKNSSANVELKIKSHFAKSLKAVNQSDTIRYIDLIPADIPPLILAEFKAVRRSMMVFSPRLSAKSLPSNRILYFCESFSMSKEAKNKILTDGFQKEHRKPGSQGIGYYFTSNPFAASVYSNGGSIIVADVILGNTYRNVKDIQPFKDCAPEGYDSALIQPSFVAQMNNNSSISDLNSPVNDSYFFSQEFVIFDAAQALPLGLINFSIVEAH